MNYLKLKEMRKERKISQEDMARAIGISLRSYQMKESGKYDFLLKEIIAISEKLDIDVDKLVKEIV